MNRSRSILILWLSLMVMNGISQEISFVRSMPVREKLSPFGRIKSFLFGKEEWTTYPFAVAKQGTDRFVVTDVQHSRVLYLNGEGQILRAVDRLDSTPLGSPVDVVVDSVGDILVVDSARRGVIRFERDMDHGSVLIADNDSRFTGIAVSGDSIYLTDAENHRIQVYTGSGQFVRTLGERGTAPGKFNYPTGIAVTGDLLIVLDTMNFRIQVLNTDGSCVRTFGRAGRTGGTFSKMKGLSVSDRGHIFVSDVDFDNVQVFDLEGNFLYVFGSGGEENGEFWMPTDVCVCDDGAILVADSFNQRIQFFVLKERNP